MTVTTKNNNSKQAKRQQTPEQAEKTAAFRAMAQQLKGELEEGKHKERLARIERDPSLEGLQRYSPLNQLLIVTQCPHATETYGYIAWQERGYQVRKGEKGIMIIAPHEKKGGKAEGQGDESTQAIGFHRIAVFDRSQVNPISDGTQEGEPEPTQTTQE